MGRCSLHGGNGDLMLEKIICETCKFSRSCECEENMICEKSGSLDFTGDEIFKLDEDDNLIGCAGYEKN